MHAHSNPTCITAFGQLLIAGVLLLLAAAIGRAEDRPQTAPAATQPASNSEEARDVEHPRTMPAASMQPGSTRKVAQEAEERADRLVTEMHHHGVFVRRSGLLGGGRITGVSITGWNEDAVKQLRYLVKLRSVDVCSLEIPDAGLRELAELEELKSVHLAGPTSDEGLKALGALKHLEELDISSAEITDESMKILGRDFPNLQQVRLWRCRSVTAAGLAEFERAMGFEVINDTSRLGKDPDLTTLKKIGR